MQSLQRPKKLTFVGSDGQEYPFLAKPKDDLRKDYRCDQLTQGARNFHRPLQSCRRGI